MSSSGAGSRHCDEPRLVPPADNRSASRSSMKRPHPEVPRNAPEGTVWFGGPIGWFSIALIVRATDLVPDEITRLLLVTPTRTQVKGVPVTQKAGARAATIGSWTVALTPHETDEWDVSEALRLLVGRFP